MGVENQFIEKCHDCCAEQKYHRGDDVPSRAVELICFDNCIHLPLHLIENFCVLNEAAAAVHPKFADIDMGIWVILDGDVFSKILNFIGSAVSILLNSSY